MSCGVSSYILVYTRTRYTPGTTPTLQSYVPYIPTIT